MLSTTLFKRVAGTALILAVAGLTGCALCADKPDAQPLPQDVPWTVSQIDGEALVEGSQVSITFTSEGRVSGRASCNGYSGTYTRTQSQLDISQLMQTKRLCHPASLMQQEQRFTALLQAVKSWEVDAQGQLHLKTAAGQSLLAKRQ